MTDTYGYPLEVVAGRFNAQWRMHDTRSYRGELCWEWIGNLDKGYGRMKMRGRHFKAHRIAYELYAGPIPDGLTIDHLCCNPGCVNPAHLEPVTREENISRSHRAGTRPRPTHCPKGHEYTEANVYVTPERVACVSGVWPRVAPCPLRETGPAAQCAGPVFDCGGDPGEGVAMRVARLATAAKVEHRLRANGSLLELFALDGLGADELRVLATRETFQPVDRVSRIPDRPVEENAPGSRPRLNPGRHARGVGMISEKCNRRQEDQEV